MSTFLVNNLLSVMGCNLQNVILSNTFHQICCRDFFFYYLMMNLSAVCGASLYCNLYSKRQFATVLETISLSILCCLAFSEICAELLDGPKVTLNCTQRGFQIEMPSPEKTKEYFFFLHKGHHVLTCSPLPCTARPPLLPWSQRKHWNKQETILSW